MLRSIATPTFTTSNATFSSSASFAYPGGDNHICRAFAGVSGAKRSSFIFFKSFKGLTDAFVSLKRSRVGARFGFMWFNSDEAADLVVLKTDGLKWKDKYLHVKRAAFGRIKVGSRSRTEALFRLRREDLREGFANDEGGSFGRQGMQWRHSGEGKFVPYKAAFLSAKRSYIDSIGRLHQYKKRRRKKEKLASQVFYKATLQGCVKKTAVVEKSRCFEPPSIVVKGLLLLLGIGDRRKDGED
ncbi:hypothetical protein Dimus_001003 [Dionaea muscipula]